MSLADKWKKREEKPKVEEKKEKVVKKKTYKPKTPNFNEFELYLIDMALDTYLKAYRKYEEKFPEGKNAKECAAIRKLRAKISNYLK